MFVVFAFGIIGGSVLAASARGPAFILRMLMFSVALSAAWTVSHGWSAGLFWAGCAVAVVSAQLGGLAVVAVRTMMAQRLAAPVLNRDASRLH